MSLLTVEHLTGALLPVNSDWITRSLKVKVSSYRGLNIIEWRTKGVEIVHPSTESVRRVKSVFAAKWRIGRAQNLARVIGRLV